MQPNLVLNLGVHSSLHYNCHQQIARAKSNLKIFCQPPYERVLWHYQDANNDIIQLPTSRFNWQKVFFLNKGVNKEILDFHKAIFNIMKHFIPYESKIFNDWEPPWIDNKAKTMIQEKNKIYQLYLKNKSNMLATKLETMQNVIYETLGSCKSKYSKSISENYVLKS